MENSIINKLSDTLNSSVLQENVGKSERIVSIGSGAFITLKGITNIFSHPYLALTELGLGGVLLYRGLTGYCPIKEKMENMAREDAPLTSPTVPVTAMPTESY